MPGAGRGPKSSLYLYHLMAKDTDDSCEVELRFSIHVLMSVNNDSRFGALDVGPKTFKSVVHFVFLIMNSSGRIVGEENVNRREGSKKAFDFPLFVQKVTPWLVFPRPVQPSEFQIGKFLNVEMNIHNRFRKRYVPVVITFNGEDR